MSDRTTTGYWKLSRDPFAAGSPALFVPTPVHAEAVARLLHAIDAVERTAVLRAEAGLGKSLVLGEVLTQARTPRRRVVRIARPLDGPSLLAGLARGLGARVDPDAGRAVAWRGLTESVRLCRLQGLGVVLAVDDAHALIEPADLRDLERLAHLDPHSDTRLTVLQVRRSGDEEIAREDDPWGLAIRLRPLTRREATEYLAAKLAAAGRTEATFTPRAINQLHALSRGVPRGLDRLASLALMAGALRRLEMIGPEVIQGVAQECAGAA